MFDELAVLLRRGDYSALEAASRSHLAAHPDDPDLQVSLGLALLNLQRAGEAESIFAELARRQPTERAHWVNLGNARRVDRRADDALTAFAHAAALGETSADFLYNVGLTHLERRDLEAAIAVLRQARERAPRDAEIRVSLARALYDAIRLDDAVEALVDWQQFDLPSTTTLAEIAQMFMNLGQAAASEAALERVLGDAALPPAAALIVIKVLERLNRVAEARDLLERVRPTVGPGEQRELRLVDSVLLQREGAHERASLLLRHTLGERGPFESRHYQLFPLAKSLDAMGRYDEAFAALVEAHASQTADVLCAHPALQLRGPPTMEITRYGVEPEDVAGWQDPDAPTAQESPVFIVAFPRSGTTLLELVLDAHPALRSMDEQPFVQNALEELLALGARYPDQLAQLDPRQLQRLRANYWERVARCVALRPDQRLVDKNPLNLLRLPVVRRLFPNAAIVLAVRHPCDVLLSCYMQHFRAPDFALLCRDLPTLANGILRAFDFWYSQAAVLRPTVLEVFYETYVADFERQTRALAQFLGLPWDDRMLAPGENARSKGFISTPSYSQVVQPVNTRSVGRWKNYRAHLAPGLQLFQPLLQRWAYTD